MKRCVRNIGICMIRLLGSEIRDANDGALLGRAFIFSWRGKLHLIGYEGPPLRAVCVPQSRVKYWRITIGFTRAEVPNFSHIDEPA